MLTPEILEFAKEAFAENLVNWRCQLIEFGGEGDHIHMLIDINPTVSVSELINNLKSASSRKIRFRFSEQLSKHYWKPYLWNRAYYAATVGNASLETIQRYVESQGSNKPGRKMRPA